MTSGAAFFVNVRDTFVYAYMASGGERIQRKARGWRGDFEGVTGGSIDQDASKWKNRGRP